MNDYFDAVCVDPLIDLFTIGKIYSIRYFDSYAKDYVFAKDDLQNKERVVPFECFKRLDIVREEKINTIFKYIQTNEAFKKI
jgi:hypothetical protein